MDSIDDDWLDALDVGASDALLLDLVAGDVPSLATPTARGSRETVREQTRSAVCATPSSSWKRCARCCWPMAALRGSSSKTTALLRAKSPRACGRRRQFERLLKSKREHDTLLTEVDKQRLVMQRLASLVLRAKRNSRHLPRAIPICRITPESFSVCEQLKLVASSMIKLADAVFADQAAANEFQTLTVCQENVHAIAIGSMVASMAARRLVPCSHHTVGDGVWKYNENDPSGLVTVLHQEQSDHSQTVYYEVQLPTQNGPARFHGVAVGSRRRAATQELIVLTSTMWPDAATESPWNALSFLVREWVLVESLPRGSLAQMQYKSQSFRYAHPNAPPTMAAREAVTLQNTLAQAHRTILQDKNNRIDDVLVGRH